VDRAAGFGQLSMVKTISYTYSLLKFAIHFIYHDRCCRLERFTMVAGN
jgi:hypothetical protein